MFCIYSTLAAAAATVRGALWTLFLKARSVVFFVVSAVAASIVTLSHRY